MVCSQSLQPTVFDSGRVVNDDVSDLIHKLEREIRTVRTVTHTTTSSWKYAHELGIEISYTPPGATGLFACVVCLFSHFFVFFQKSSTGVYASNSSLLIDLVEFDRT
jgi:hypothetical protein